jgi:hypothetical protein
MVRYATRREHQQSSSTALQKEKFFLISTTGVLHAFKRLHWFCLIYVREWKKAHPHQKMDFCTKARVATHNAVAKQELVAIFAAMEVHVAAMLFRTQLTSLTVDSALLGVNTAIAAYRWPKLQ